MFFVQPGLPKWNVSAVTDMSELFRDAIAFYQILLWRMGDLKSKRNRHVSKLFEVDMHNNH